MADPITLPSGKMLQLNAPSFEEANALKKVVLRELVNVQVDLSNLDLNDVKGSDILALKNVL